MLRLLMRTLRNLYTDFTQLLSQAETISGLCLRTYMLTNLVMRYPGFAVPLMFASNLLKGMIMLSPNQTSRLMAGLPIHPLYTYGTHLNFWLGGTKIFFFWGGRTLEKKFHWNQKNPLGHKLTHFKCFKDKIKLSDQRLSKLRWNFF